MEALMFKDLLDSIIERTEGSLGALIMGTDGIAGEKVLGEAGQVADHRRGAARRTGGGHDVLGLLHGGACR